MKDSKPATNEQRIYTIEFEIYDYVMGNEPSDELVTYDVVSFKASSFGAAVELFDKTKEDMISSYISDYGYINEYLEETNTNIKNMKPEEIISKFDELCVGSIIIKVIL